MGKSSMQLFAEDFQQLQDKSGHNFPVVSLLVVVCKKDAHLSANTQQLLAD